MSQSTAERCAAQILEHAVETDVRLTQMEVRNIARSEKLETSTDERLRQILTTVQELQRDNDALRQELHKVKQSLIDSEAKSKVDDIGALRQELTAVKQSLIDSGAQKDLRNDVYTALSQLREEIQRPCSSATVAPCCVTSLSILQHSLQSLGNKHATTQQNVQALTHTVKLLQRAVASNMQISRSQTAASEQNLLARIQDLNQRLEDAVNNFELSETTSLHRLQQAEEMVLGYLRDYSVPVGLQVEA